MKPCIECKTPQSTAHVICPDCLKRLKSESSNWEEEAATLLDASAKKLEEVTRELARARDAFWLAVRSVYTIAAYMGRDALDLPDCLVNPGMDEVARINRIVKHFEDVVRQAE